ncbi:type II toxin-antitoxin system VapC family toxin [Candidatus Woesearchaeota archaeon]|nr:type II toxin-antitoxin system VapC family toxin [Candidatus Woesearchaeota archaeon]
MILVLDTSILIELERKNISVIEKLRKYVELYPSPAQITFMNYFEFYHGLQNKNIKNKEKVLSFINKFNILKLTKETAKFLSDLKTKYDNQGISISLADLIIASQVIENNLILITLDKDFEKIKELKKIIL